MATECDATKSRRYDLTMSRRTRRPTSSVACSSDDQDAEEPPPPPPNSGDPPRLSLQELITEDMEAGIQGGGEHAAAERTSVPDAAGAAAGAQKLAVALKQPEHAAGAKMAGMVRLCVKAFSSMVKARRASKKKNVVPLLMK